MAQQVPLIVSPSTRHRRFPSDATQSDVFGNELLDVDVWGDVAFSDDDDFFSPKEGSSRFVHQALSTMEDQPPAPPTSPPKPPRTPNGSGRKTMVVKQPSSVLPPMTPRSKMRLKGRQLSNPKITSPLPDGTEKEKLLPQFMSVAEKRRQRHEHANGIEQSVVSKPFPRLVSPTPTVDSCSTHTGTTAQLDGSLSSLSLCPSHFTVLSKGSGGDSTHTIESRDVYQMHNSYISPMRRERSLSRGRDVVAPTPKPADKDASDLQNQIHAALQHINSRARTPRRGRRCDRDSNSETSSVDIPPPPRAVACSRNTRGSRQSSNDILLIGNDSGARTPRAGNKSFQNGSGDLTTSDEDRSRRSTRSCHSRSVRSNSSSRACRTVLSNAVASPKKTMEPDTKPTFRSRSERHEPDTKPIFRSRSERHEPDTKPIFRSRSERHEPDTKPVFRSRSERHPLTRHPSKGATHSKPPRTKSFGDAEKHPRTPPSTKRSPSPLIVRKSHSIESERRTRTSSTNSQRKTKTTKDIVFEP